eukprot:CAMPEP_0195105806 /NCGR_PEP_ID=MMETSP0448-20130528/78017_1 /TAXON_ID=66468 /ORGANISM="Heterocapsa triquestra, Strain CCMP 448" /LENGTH=84 /DNA_ID=CAMNT_0040141917 /DNA_START=341 /DNA_END=592 /DNA_ORIENTATION=-
MSPDFAASSIFSPSSSASALSRREGPRMQMVPGVKLAGAHPAEAAESAAARARSCPRWPSEPHPRSRTSQLRAHPSAAASPVAR